MGSAAYYRGKRKLKLCVCYGCWDAVEKGVRCVPHAAIHAAQDKKRRNRKFLKFGLRVLVRAGE